MRSFPHDWNPEMPGSRFTSRVALAVVSRRGGASIYGSDPDSIPVEAVIRDALAADPSQFQELGPAQTVEGSYGRGAAGLAAVVEWTLEAAATGIIGAAAWVGVTQAAARLRKLLGEMRGEKVQVLVSRGAAAFLAIDHVITTETEVGILDIEAVQEPSALTGREVTELGYVGAEPWLVSLVNASRSDRYIVAVQPDGEITGVLHLPIGEIEAVHLALPPRDDA